MQVFGAILSPFVRKVHLVAAEKGVEFEAVPTNPRQPSPEFAAASPFSKIPALKDGDFTLADSTAIAVYLDASHPAPPMLPGSPQARARGMWFDEYADTIIFPPAVKVVFNRLVGPRFVGVPGDEAIALQGVEELQPVFDYLEGVAPAAGWLAGDDFSLGDIAVASMLKTLSYVGIDLGPDRPRAAAWYARVCARASWQSVAAYEATVMRG